MGAGECRLGEVTRPAGSEPPLGCFADFSLRAILKLPCCVRGTNLSTLDRFGTNLSTLEVRGNADMAKLPDQQVGSLTRVASRFRGLLKGGPALEVY